MARTINHVTDHPPRDFRQTRVMAICGKRVPTRQIILGAYYPPSCVGCRAILIERERERQLAGTSK